MHRRTFLCRLAATATIALGAQFVWPRRMLAQAATPAAGFAQLGLPEVTIAVDDRGFTLPGALTAGRVLMTVENRGEKELHFFAARVPDEITDEQLAKDMAGNGDPPWFDMTKLTLLGAPDWPAPGKRAQGVVDLGAGRWLFVDPIDGRDVALATVGAGSGGATVEPAADVVVGLREMEFTGLDEPVPAGQRIWKIANQGALEHELAVLAVPAGTTKADVIAMLTAMFSGQGDPAAFAPLGGQGISSKGVTSWQLLDLPRGTYAALCMSPMPGQDFEPHALEGMVKIFTAG